MIVDIATRKGATIKDVADDSQWINGYDWMTEDVSKFPIKSREEIKLTTEDIKAVSKESSIQQMHFISKVILDELQKRYEHSSYLIDPCKYQFKNVVRIMAIVIKFINNCKLSKKERSEVTTIKNPLLLWYT